METFCPELLCLCVFVLLFRFILLTQKKVLRSLLKRQKRQDIKIKMERVFSAGRMGICFSWTHYFFSRDRPGLPTKTSGSKITARAAGEHWQCSKNLKPRETLRLGGILKISHPILHLMLESLSTSAGNSPLFKSFDNLEC